MGKCRFFTGTLSGHFQFRVIAMGLYTATSFGVLHRNAYFTEDKVCMPQCLRHNINKST